jgi:hypothetical protein
MSLLRSFLAALGIVVSLGANADNSKVVADAMASAEWIAKALSASGYKADFSVESLREVDRFFDDHAPNGHPKPGGFLSSDVGARLFALGGYVGEVIRRASGGEWKGNDKDPQAEITIALQLKSGTTLWPVQRIMKRFQNGSEDGVYVYGVAATRP